LFFTNFKIKDDFYPFQDKQAEEEEPLAEKRIRVDVNARGKHF
jgi:hypothetical protein